jgi:hypothetical protein
MSETLPPMAETPCSPICPRCGRPRTNVEALNDAAELLAEIMRDEVNHQDEAEKWLRAYAPQYLANK